MNNKQKRRALSIALLLLMLSVLSYGTYAFFTSSGIATNVITTGSIDIQIVEYAETEDGLLVPYEDVFDVMPDEKVSKIPCINNVGTNEAWIRVAIEQDITLASDMDLSEDEISEYEASEYETPGDYSYTWEQIGDKWHYMDEQGHILSYDINTEYWMERGGYWWYKDPVPAGEITKPLFNNVFFDGVNMDNPYQNAVVTVTIKAEATQYVHNGSTVFEALGWQLETDD